MSKQKLEEFLRTGKPRERIVSIDDQSYLVIGFGKKAKHDIRNQYTDDDGTVDTERLESALLKECLYDPDTRERLCYPDDDSHIPGHVAGPLVSAIMWACGYDREDTGRTEKN